MATIKDLPEEILLLIFSSNNFYASELNECQRVCRAWYHPARIKLLKSVGLTSPLKVEQFIESIDANPKPEYLKAVKSIMPMTHDQEVSPIWCFSEDTIRKLFLRFPNLEEVWCDNFSTLFDDFDDDICNDFVKMYPKFKLFRVEPGYGDDMDYSDLLFKLRQLITFIDMNILENVWEYGGIIHYLSSFPRLTEIEGPFDGLDSFAMLLPVFEKLPNLTKLEIRGEDGQENFAETYLATKPKDVQDLVVERLSRITHLRWTSFPDISINTMKFVSKYLTGLEVFSVSSSNNVNWTKVQQDLYFSDVMDRVCSAKSSGSVNLDMLRITDVSKCFSAIADRIFHQTPPNVFRSLEICASYKLELVNWISMQVRQDLNTRKIGLTFKSQLALQEIVASLFNEEPLDYIDVLKIGLGEMKVIPEVTMDMYNRVLGCLPSLKKVSLDIPIGFKDNKTSSLQNNEHPLVETLALYTAPDIKIQTLLNTSYYSFPSMKHLSLYYYTGAWEEHFKRFQIRLPKHSLESLTIDTTPVVIKMRQNRSKPVSMEDDFMLIKLKMFDTDETLEFFASLDLKTVRKFTFDDFVKYYREGYYPLHITVKSLQKLKLCVLPGIMNYEVNERYSTMFIKTVTAYNKLLS